MKLKFKSASRSCGCLPTPQYIFAALSPLPFTNGACALLYAQHVLIARETCYRQLQQQQSVQR